MNAATVGRISQTEFVTRRIWPVPTEHSVGLDLPRKPSSQQSIVIGEQTAWESEDNAWLCRAAFVMVVKATDARDRDDGAVGRRRA